jgi:hypothetical protein
LPRQAARSLQADAAAGPGDHALPPGSGPGWRSQAALVPSPSLIPCGRGCAGRAQPCQPMRAGRVCAGPEGSWREEIRPGRSAGCGWRAGCGRTSGAGRGR